MMVKEKGVGSAVYMCVCVCVCASVSVCMFIVLKCRAFWALMQLVQCEGCCTSTKLADFLKPPFELFAAFDFTVRCNLCPGARPIF